MKNYIRYLSLYIVFLFPNLIGYLSASYLAVTCKKNVFQVVYRKKSRSFFSGRRSIQIPDPHHLFPPRIPPTLQRSWGKFGGRLHNTFRHVQLPKCGGEPVKIWCISKFWRGGPKGMRRVRC